MELTASIKQKACDLGFDLVGITTAEPIAPDQVELLNDWLKAGLAGQMEYMHRNLHKRTSPAVLLKGAQSVIVAGLNYTPAQLPKTPDSCEPQGRVANYAQYENYHQFIKKRLRKLTEFILSLAGKDITFKICVDSTPLAERALAERAGIGFIGRNHILTNPKLGNHILLGEIITTLKLQPDKPFADKCANCDNCLNACPTNALRPDGQFDANKCISYLTTEYKANISPRLAEKIGDRILGCDQCALACPYQNSAPPCKNKEFTFYPKRAKLNLLDILNLSPEQFKTRFAGTCFERIGLDQLKRNARICLANA